jgi:hypothetical protein
MGTILNIKVFTTTFLVGFVLLCFSSFGTSFSKEKNCRCYFESVDLTKESNEIPFEIPQSNQEEDSDTENEKETEKDDDKKEQNNKKYKRSFEFSFLFHYSFSSYCKTIEKSLTKQFLNIITPPPELS